MPWITNNQAKSANEIMIAPRQRTRARFWSVGVLLLVEACTAPGAVVGLRPEYPPIGQLWGYGYEFVQLDSLQPTLRWEAFPRERDREENKEILGHLTTVTYDLQIWLAGDIFPAERIYAKRGLPEASHRIEQPLTPATMYYWTVRARFQINAEPRVTEWGMYEKMLPWQEALRQQFGDMLPNPLYFRFKTPPQ
jgi:hypothetical protein